MMILILNCVSLGGHHLIDTSTARPAKQAIQEKELKSKISKKKGKSLNCDFKRRN